jgi:hypothetical protein
MQIAHVFEEEDRKLWKHHMKAFFGQIPDTGDEYNPEDQSYIICYCGARINFLGDSKNGESVGAVWHNLVRIKDGDDEDE